MDAAVLRVAVSMHALPSSTPRINPPPYDPTALLWYSGTVVRAAHHCTAQQ
jgi:hypothetical protein